MKKILTPILLVMLFAGLPGCQSALNTETYDQFIAALRALTPETATDFRPQLEYEGWTYFYVPDETSIYRFCAEAETPELVIGDCEGIAEVQGDRLYYCMGDDELWYLDLQDQTTAQASTVSFYRSTVTLLDDMVITSDYGYVGIHRMSRSTKSEQTLTIDGLYVIDLVWCDGSTLYYTAAEDIDDALMNPTLYQWDFIHDPVPITPPEGFTAIRLLHKENTVFFVGEEVLNEEGLYQKELVLLTLPDERMETVEVDGSYTNYGIEVLYDAYQQGLLTTSYNTAVQETTGYLSMQLAHEGYSVQTLGNGFAICQDTETHTDGSSQCAGKACAHYDEGYYHHYTRTSVYRLPSGELVWSSNGDIFWWDT